MIVIPRDEEFIAKERRARTILRRLKACHRVVAFPRSINPAADLNRSNYTTGAGEASPQRDWMADVTNALSHGAGPIAGRVLVMRLTRQQQSQACSRRTIAMQLGIAEGDVDAFYVYGLTWFLYEMDVRGIADDYRPEPEMPAVVIRRSARSETQVK